MNTENSKILKSNIDNEISSSHEEFKGFSRFSNENYFYSQDLEGTYIDMDYLDDRSKKWVFNKFEWFPEGLYGEVINFQNGGDDYDHEIIGERRKFLIIGSKLEEMKINIQGQGWKDLKNTDLYKILKNSFTK